MPKANRDSTTTRRQLLTNAAAVAVVSTVATQAVAIEADPIFAAIEAHREATRAICAVLDRLADAEMKFPVGSPERQAAQDDEGSAGDAEIEAIDAMVNTPIATGAGAVALLTYIDNEIERGNDIMSGENWHDLMTGLKDLLAAKGGAA